jgi:hypothetical protein
VSSLWTPDGEHDIPKGEAAPPSAAPANPATSASPEQRDPEIDREIVEEMADLEAELIAAPVEEVIANHCYGLFQLAAIHLGHQPPNLPAARLAIDAYGAIVEGLDTRLGAPSETLRDGLAQLRIAFVQISAAASAQANEAVADPPAT